MLSLRCHHKKAQPHDRRNDGPVENANPHGGEVLRRRECERPNEQAHREADAGQEANTRDINLVAVFGQCSEPELHRKPAYAENAERLTDHQARRYSEWEWFERASGGEVSDWKTGIREGEQW